MPFGQRFITYNLLPSFPIHTLPQKLAPGLIPSMKSHDCSYMEYSNNHITVIPPYSSHSLPCLIMIFLKWTYAINSMPKNHPMAPPHYRINYNSFSIADTAFQNLGPDILSKSIVFLFKPKYVWLMLFCPLQAFIFAITLVFNAFYLLPNI